MGSSGSSEADKQDTPQSNGGVVYTGNPWAEHIKKFEKDDPN